MSDNASEYERGFSAAKEAALECCTELLKSVQSSAVCNVRNSISLLVPRVSPVAARHVTFNVNDYVQVRLTDKGREIILRENESIRKSVPKYGGRKVEETDGWSRWQLWDLMGIFGSACFLGGQVPFEPTIRFEFADRVQAVAFAPTSLRQGEAWISCAEKMPPLRVTMTTNATEREALPMSMRASEPFDPIEYLLHTMEEAAHHDKPADHGYGDKRRALIAAIKTLRAERDTAVKQLAERASAEKDATRYRWLRSEGLSWFKWEHFTTETCDVGLDAAIDHWLKVDAMNAEPTK